MRSHLNTDKVPTLSDEPDESRVQRIAVIVHVHLKSRQPPPVKEEVVFTIASLISKNRERKRGRERETERDRGRGRPVDETRYT